jgi:hypothetical protein
MRAAFAAPWKGPAMTEATDEEAFELASRYAGVIGRCEALEEVHHAIDAAFAEADELLATSTLEGVEALGSALRSYHAARLSFQERLKALLREADDERTVMKAERAALGPR